MWAYWLLFLVPAGIAVSPIKGDKNINSMMWVMVSLLIILLMGLRYDVGGDWPNYLAYLDDAELLKNDLGKVLIVGNANGAAYMFINWIAVKLGLGIYFVNTICAVLFMVGLIKYCQRQPFPWIALAVGIPYLVLVVGMGYTRQAVALGFVFWGLSFLRSGTEPKFFAMVLIGTLFHISAIVNVPYMALTRKRILWWYYLVFGLFIGAVYYLVIYLDLWQYYLAAVTYTLDIQSQGGAIRTFMNVLPVLVAFFFWNRIKMISSDYKIIKWMAIAALLSMPALSVSSTMVDRFALFLIPLQLALWPRIIAVQKTELSRSIWASIILSYYGLVLFVWFNYATHAYRWLPYRLLPFNNETIYPYLIPM